MTIDDVYAWCLPLPFNDETMIRPVKCYNALRVKLSASPFGDSGKGLG
jgi:hypothetical protein